MRELIEAELAAELPSHMRAFARAHAEGRSPPPAPAIVLRASTLAAARSSESLLRLVAPIVIEADPAVTAARAEPPSWPGLARLAAARDAVTRAKFGCAAIELLHRLYGVREYGTTPEVGPTIEGWRTRDHSVDVDEAWRLIAARFGMRGDVFIERSDTAHPRAFVVEPEREVIVVVPRVVDTPAARFAVLHELGHAVVALALPAVPRVADEAGAAFVARALEEHWLPGWHSELAAAARVRRTALASVLDAVERRLPDVSGAPGARPPWALWHDPGAQAAYVSAERIAAQLDDIAQLKP